MWPAQCGHATRPATPGTIGHETAAVRARHRFCGRRSRQLRRRNVGRPLHHFRCRAHLWRSRHSHLRRRRRRRRRGGRGRRRRWRRGHVRHDDRGVAARLAAVELPAGIFVFHGVRPTAVHTACDDGHGEVPGGSPHIVQLHDPQCNEIPQSRKELCEQLRCWWNFCTQNGEGVVRRKIHPSRGPPWPASP